MTADLRNNIISGTTLPTLVERADRATVTGSNNWLATGVKPGPLLNSIFSASPGFRDASTLDFILAPNSVAIGNADLTVVGLPDREYYQNEVNPRQYRPRASARDIGAFESMSTGSGIGPYGPVSLPALRAGMSGGSLILSWPLTAAGYVLDRTASLGASIQWDQVPSPYPTNSNDFSVTVRPTGTSTFYRLRKP
jgi:hypothetical protein